jgi:nitroreductase
MQDAPPEGPITRSRNAAALEFLAERRSVPSRLLTEPGPDEAQQRELFALAVRVPDHGKLVPWRFVRIEGDARHALGETLVALASARNPDAEAAALEKDRMRFAHAPLVIAVVSRTTPGHKVPEQEQLLSAGAVCFNLLLGAQALGFGAQWLTAWPAYDREVAKVLGLADDEKVVGFIHVGTPKDVPSERPRPDPADLVSDLRLPRG